MFGLTQVPAFGAATQAFGTATTTFGAATTSTQPNGFGFGRAAAAPSFGATVYV